MNPDAYSRKAPAQLEEPEENTASSRLSEEEQVYGWRYQSLHTAGYSDAYAAQLAALLYVDLHQACSMLEQGCPQQLAVEILR